MTIKPEGGAVQGRACPWLRGVRGDPPATRSGGTEGVPCASLRDGLATGSGTGEGTVRLGSVLVNLTIEGGAARSPRIGHGRRGI